MRGSTSRRWNDDCASVPRGLAPRRGDPRRRWLSNQGISPIHREPARRHLLSPDLYALHDRILSLLYIESSMIRILVADDHAIMREGLRWLVETEPGLRVVGEARNSIEAYEQTRQLRPDVVVLDLTMPGLNGLEALERIGKDCPDVRVLVLTVHEDRPNVLRVLHAGASGYMLKRSPWSELLRAIRAVGAGQRYVDSLLSEVLVEQTHVRRSRRHPGEPGENEVDALTGREKDVLQLLARGHGNKEIASMLAISVKTVETHRAAGMSRLGVRTRAALVGLALSEGWLAGR